MEAVYVNSLSMFTITLFLLMTYINNWFRSYRNKLHSDMNRSYYFQGREIFTLEVDSKKKKATKFTNF